MATTDVEKLLAIVECSDLYEFLTMARSATLAELKKAADKRYQELKHKTSKGYDLETRKKLVGTCQDIFRTEESRRQYDRTLEEATLKATLKRLLEIVECSNLYEFLKVARSATLAELKEAADNVDRKLQNQTSRDDELNARKKLVGHCKETFFRTEESRRQYDRTLEEQEASSQPKYPDGGAGGGPDVDEQPGTLLGCGVLIVVVGLIAWAIWIWIVPLVWPGPDDSGTTGPRSGIEGPTVPVEPGPTAQTEGDLNITRSDWRRIQAGLQALRHYTGAIDGLAGPRTRASITAWQRTQRGVATSFLNRAQADALIALAPAPQPPGEQPGTAPAATNARLVIRAAPNSRIALDDEEAGFTSESGILTIDEVTPGGHVLSAEKDGFATVTSTIEITEGVSQVVELVARALPGRLTVTTNADNAIVAIDGGEPRAAPVDDIEVESGARLVTVSAPGYNTDEQYVDIDADTTTTYHATLEETSLDTEIAQLRRLFDSRSYEAAAETAGLLARTLVTWGNQGVDVRENLALMLTIQGRALYALGNFAESVQPLYNAVRFGQQIELPIKHRHGGGGFRQGFCTGFLVYSLDQIAFRSIDDPDHGFAVEPEDIRRIEAAEAQEGYLSRLNTEVDGRGSMDFVHPNSEQQRRDPDSPLVTDIVCRNCNHALAVHEQMLRFLTRNTQ